MASGYKFPILNSDGTYSNTKVDFDDMFVPQNVFSNYGLQSWGQAGFGVLGDGTTVDKSSPQRIGTLTNWITVSKNVRADGLNIVGSAYAIRADGTLWAWGHNSSYELGNNNTINRSSPVQVGTISNWKQVTSGDQFAAAITQDGALYVWGSRANGKLGTGTTSGQQTTPFRIDSNNNWKFVAAGNELCMAIKTDGSLWAWGENGQGELGLGDNNNRSSPVQVGTQKDWKQVAPYETTCYGLKNNGTIWAWGDAASGKLGVLSSVDVSSPIQIGTESNWKQISQAIAIKNDGTLWSWGVNSSGEIGDGTKSIRSTPIQIGSMTNWKFVYKKKAAVFAIKTDGSLWSWGDDNSVGSGFAGDLGNGIISRSSPTQVGSFTNWKTVERAIGILSQD